MGKIFLIAPDDEGWGKTNNYLINAVHECGLPGVSCNVCESTWSNTGVFYPSVDCSILSVLREAMKPRPVPLDEFKKLVETVKSRLGTVKFVLDPGTDFGPLNGTAMGKFGDFSWVNPWTPLVRLSVFDQFLLKGVELIGIKANLRFRKKDMEPLVELEAHPCVELHDSCLPGRPLVCPACGRRGIKAPDKIVVAKSSVDERNPIQRIVELPTYLVVNERMASLILEMKLRDVMLEEVSVA